MNGTISGVFVFDTNVVIDLLDDKLTSLPVGERLISVVTEIELRAAASTARDEVIRLAQGSNTFRPRSVLGRGEKSEKVSILPIMRFLVVIYFALPYLVRFNAY